MNEWVEWIVMWASVCIWGISAYVVYVYLCRYEIPHDLELRTVTACMWPLSIALILFYMAAFRVLDWVFFCGPFIARLLPHLPGEKKPHACQSHTRVYD